MKFKALIVYPLVLSFLIGPSADAKSPGNDKNLNYKLLKVAAHYNAAADKVEFLKGAFLEINSEDRKFLESGLTRLKGASFPQMSLSGENSLSFSSEGHSFELKMIDLERGTLKLNEIVLHLDPRKSLEANYQEMERAVKQTLHASNPMDLLIPQAYAFAWLPLAVIAWLGVGIWAFLLPEIREAPSLSGPAKDMIPCLEKMEQLKAEGAVSKQLAPLPSEQIEQRCKRKGITKKFNTTNMHWETVEYTYLDRDCVFGKTLDHCLVELTKLYTAKKMDTTHPMSNDQLSKVGDYLEAASASSAVV